MTPLTRKAAADITGRKLRSTLALVALAAGVMGVTGVTAAAGQLDESFTWSASVSAHPDLELFTSHVNASEVSVLTQPSSVSLVDVRDVEPVLWQTPGGPRLLTVIGTGSADAAGRRSALLAGEKLGSFQMDQGSFPHGAQLLVEQHDRSLSAVELGAQLSLQAGASIHRLRVSGLTRTRDRSLSTLRDAALAYMDPGEMQRLFGAPAMSDILIRIRPGSDAAALATGLTRSLRSRHVSVFDVQAGASSGSKHSVDAFLLESGVVAGAVLLLGIVLVLGTIDLLLEEQRYMIAELRAMGGTDARIKRAYLVTAVIFAGIAGSIGFLAGLVVADALVRSIASELTLDIGALSVQPQLLLIAPVLAFVGSILGTYLLVSMRVGGYRVHTRTWLRIVPSLAGRLRRTLRLLGPVRTLTATGITVGVLAASGAIFFAAQSDVASIDRAARTSLGLYHADLFVDLVRDQPFPTVQATAAATAGVRSVEPYGRAQVQTPWGSASLVGLDAATRLYHPELTRGRWLRSHERGVAVIGQDMATRTGLGVGDRIRVQTESDSRALRIVGIARDWAGLTAGVGAAGTVLTTIEEFESVRHFPATYARGLLVRARTPSAPAVTRLAHSLDDNLARAGLPASVTTASQRTDEQQSQLAVLYGLFYLGAALMGLLGFAAVAGHLQAGIVASRRELGVLRAMGARGRDIARAIFREGLFLGLCASILAAAIGVPVAAGLLQLLKQALPWVPLTFSTGVFAATIIYLLFLAVVATLPPVWFALRLRTADALRHK